LVAIGLPLSALLWTGAVDLAAPRQAIDLDTACAEGRPFFAAVCYPSYPPGFYAANGDASVILFSDTPGDSPQYTLTRQRQTGAVYGLAYSQREQALFISAFRRRGIALGPAGIGGIYRLDLQTGRFTEWVRVPNAARSEPVVRNEDTAARREAGKMGLGDLDLNADETELYAVNLFDQRIYRYSLPDGTLLGSFDHGAAASPWAADARPFGLTFHDGRLYHGVVHSAQSSRKASDLRALVYASEWDGSNMHQVAELALDYPRGEVVAGGNRERFNLDWRPWSDTVSLNYRWLFMSVAPMPMVSDLVVDRDGGLTIGLRDRLGDMVWTYPHGSPLEAGAGFGDLLYGAPSGNGWQVGADPEHYFDGFEGSDQGAYGSLAYDWRADRLISLQVNRSYGHEWVPFVYEAAAQWYEPRTANKTSLEHLCPFEKTLPSPWQASASVFSLGAIQVAHADNEGLFTSLGDVETLCGPWLAPTPTPTDTLTPVPSETPTPTHTVPVVPSATTILTRPPPPTASPTPAPLVLPVALKEQCSPAVRRADVALVLDASSSMLEPSAGGRAKIDAAKAAARGFLQSLDLAGGDQVAVIWFNERAHLELPLSRDRAQLDAALDRITTAQLTRIDLGVATARLELGSLRRRLTNTPVMIVLTDGRANPVGPEAAVLEAAAAKEAGILLFTIGLGDDLDFDALQAMASRPDYFYRAPDAEQLGAIYATIATTIPCPASGFWSRRQ
jgi:hypothetical protein